MFKAEIEIRNADEFRVFSMMLDAISQDREAKLKQYDAQLNATQALMEVPQAPSAPPSPEPEVVGDIPTAMAKKAAGPTLVATKTEERSIPDVQMIESFQRYVGRTRSPHGELVELLKKYGAGRVLDVPQERRAEFLAEIGE